MFINRLKIYIRAFFAFLKAILDNKTLLIDLVKRDIKMSYLGSYLGIIWAFIQPTFTILIMWFVFEVGFKSQPVEGIPFILWLICGMIPWFFISDSISNGSNSIIDNSFLVQKVVFKVSLLPIVKIVSALFIHVFFILFIMIMFLIYNFTPDLYWLEVFYYLFASIVLLIGVSWITSSVVIFFKDFGHVIAVVLQFLFWSTPIFWSFNMIPLKYQMLLKLNPIFYIVSGYRDAFIDKIGFWNRPTLGLVFWVEALVIFLVGAIVFKKLRPHFADVI